MKTAPDSSRRLGRALNGFFERSDLGARRVEKQLHFLLDACSLQAIYSNNLVSVVD